MRILDRQNRVARGDVQSGFIRRHAAGHIIAERNEVDRVLLHHFIIARRLHDMDVVILIIGQQRRGIFAEHLRVAVRINAAHPLLRFQHVLRLAGIRVVGQLRDHAANLGIRNDLVADLGCQRRGDKLMMHRLVTDLFKVLPRETVFDQTAGCVGMADDAVNLIEGQPVFYLVLVAFADRPDILFKEADDFTEYQPSCLSTRFSGGS